MNHKTIGIISIKGGVGKTSVTSALGATMANDFGKKVLLIDGNFSAPNLAMHIGIEAGDASIHRVLEGKISLKDAIISSEYGFDILAGNYADIKIDPLKLPEYMRDLKRKYDVILIDSSPNLNQEVLATMMASDELLVVTTPDHVTLATTMRAINLAKSRKTPITGIIINKVHNKKFELSLEQIEATCACPVVGVIPHDLDVLKSLSKNRPSTLSKGSSTEEYKKLAASIIGQEYRGNKFKNFLRKFLSSVPKHEVNQTILKNERQSNPFY